MSPWALLLLLAQPTEAELFAASDAGFADAGVPQPPLPLREGGGEGRPSEAELFGGPDASPPPPEGAVQVQPHGTESEQAQRDAERLGLPAAQSAFDTGEAAANPLTVGGTLYLRTIASGNDADTFKTISLAAPNLFDGYLDARPSDRVRGFLLARMRYDPLLDPQATSQLPTFTGATRPTTENPGIFLDQLWLRFDIARVVFVTAGKQHAKWGVSRFWNPTDFLTPERKDPLAVFDDRLGANMVKLHVPWEARGWNFYAIGLFDNRQPADELAKLGGALRAEIVFGNTELGADAVFVGQTRPRYGFDLSSALGPFDVYGELALRRGGDFQLVRTRGELDLSQPLFDQLELFSPQGVQVATSGGLTYQWQYTEQNVINFGAEYFYNGVGTSEPELYPLLLATGRFTPFYVGKHYAALYALASGLPGGLEEVTVVLSNIGNLSDLSFITRADVFIRVLSYLTVELFGSVHYGKRGGEFRLGFDTPVLTLVPGQTVPPISVPAPVADFGVGLRVGF